VAHDLLPGRSSGLLPGRSSGLLPGRSSGRFAWAEAGWRGPGWRQRGDEVPDRVARPPGIPEFPGYPGIGTALILALGRPPRS